MANDSLKKSPETTPVAAGRTEIPDLQKYLQDRGIHIDLERLQSARASAKGRLGLLKEIQEKNPGIKPEEVKSVVDHIGLNLEQIAKKEGFLSRMAKAPFRFAWKHPFLTAAGLAGAATVGYLYGPIIAAKIMAATEGVASSVPLNQVIEHIKSVLPWSEKLPAGPVFEPPAGNFA